MTKFAHSLLTLAVSSSVALAQGGWSGAPGKGLNYDGGDTFSFKMANQLQTHWTFTANDGGTDTNNFTIRRARTKFSGHAYNKNINYVLLVDATDSGSSGDGNIKDAHITWSFLNDDSGSIGLRMGQGKTLFGLEGTGSSSGLTFVERSLAARGFSDARSRGAWLVGSQAENKLRWAAGAMNGSTAHGLTGASVDLTAAGTATDPIVGASGYTDRGEETSNSDNELSYVLSASFDPLGDCLGGKGNESFKQGDFRTDNKSLRGTIGLGVALENGKDATSGADVESTSINVNTAWQAAGFQFMGEYFMRTDEGTSQNFANTGAATDKEESSGWAASVGWIMPKSSDTAIQWGFGARISSAENDIGNDIKVDYLGGLQGIGATPGDVTELSFVANAFYHGHACKTQLEYTIQDVNPTAGGDTTNHIVRVAFQLLF
ncbi:MAG: hypothetical protein KDC98_00575 [Planctomycetes bacterium]|nr:hypothetical protein [Planctomycetota bacterium]